MFLSSNQDVVRTSAWPSHELQELFDGVEFAVLAPLRAACTVSLAGHRLEVSGG
jgi:hypothetical protein